MYMNHTFFPGTPKLIGRLSKLPVNKPVKLTVSNKNLVIWKNILNKVTLFPNACPHAGAELSQGEIAEHGSQIVCKYHNIAFHSSGFMAKNSDFSPCDQIYRKQWIEPYDVVVDGDFIWSYLDNEEPVTPIPAFTSIMRMLSEHDFVEHTFIERVTTAPFQAIIENLLDSKHFAGTHSGSMLCKEVEISNLDVRQDVIEWDMTLNKDTTKWYHTWKPWHALIDTSFTQHVTFYLPSILTIQFTAPTTNLFGIAYSHQINDLENYVSLQVFHDAQFPWYIRWYADPVINVLRKTLFGEDLAMLQTVDISSPRRFYLPQDEPIRIANQLLKQLYSKEPTDDVFNKYFEQDLTH